MQVVRGGTGELWSLTVLDSLLCGLSRADTGALTCRRHREATEASVLPKLPRPLPRKARCSPKLHPLSPASGFFNTGSQTALNSHSLASGEVHFQGGLEAWVFGLALLLISR